MVVTMCEIGEGHSSVPPGMNAVSFPESDGCKMQTSVKSALSVIKLVKGYKLEYNTIADSEVTCIDKMNWSRNKFTD